MTASKSNAVSLLALPQPEINRIRLLAWDAEDKAFDLAMDEGRTTFEAEQEAHEAREAKFCELLGEAS